MSTTPFAEQAPAPLPVDPAELAGYRPPRNEPDDFDNFWKSTLAEYRPPRAEPAPHRVDAGLRLVETYDVSFVGYGGDRIQAWLVLPAGAGEPLPCVVQFVGYGGGRGLVIDHLVWAAAGYAHLVMDARGQGDTPDPGATSSVPAVVSGLPHAFAYYYRRLFVDGVCAVGAARELPGIDPHRVVVAGASQGGGVALAVAALDPDVAALLCDIPFLCHWERAVRLADRGPYVEVARQFAEHRYPVAPTLAALAYFDGMNFAPRAHVPALFSVALADRVCPPSTVYAAYNYYAGAKRIVEWEFNDHEGGGSHQTSAQLAFLDDLWRQG